MTSAASLVAIVLAGIVALLIWVVPLVDLLKRDEAQWHRVDESKAVWTVVVVVLGPFGGLLYWLIARPKLTGGKSYRTIDLVTIATLGVAFGAIYWGWDYSGYEVWSKASYALYPPSAGLFWGVWLIAGVVGGVVVRKPGAALATELIAASVEALIPGGNPWGFGTLISGGLQGLGAELIFAVFLYRRFNLVVAALAGALAASFETLWEWHAYYAKWHLQDKLAYLGFFAVSGAVIAGVGGWLLVRALARTGVLDSFPAGREAAGEI